MAFKKKILRQKIKSCRIKRRVKHTNQSIDFIKDNCEQEKDAKTTNVIKLRTFICLV